MRDKRVPGGEITAKTGIPWEKYELEQVCLLYFELGGKGIHENNIKIHYLANKLGRGVRATEAQLLMFRALDKGEYGYKKMNQLCTNVWEDMSIEYKGSVKETLFPSVFNSWTSESSGGIRKPFDNTTGRPTNLFSKGRIPTLISTKLELLISNPNELEIKAIFLIGGPGNGKTDSMEFVIEKIDQKYNLAGELLVRTNSNFENYGRKQEIRLEKLNAALPWEFIEIVQDASERDIDSNNSCDALLNDILKISNQPYPGLFICCANRGIIDKVRREISRRVNLIDDTDKKVELVKAQELINTIIYSISPNSDGCWPLKRNDYKDIYVWPMDVESLIEQYDLEKSPIQNLLELALINDNWEEWPDVNYNPIKDNYNSLANTEFSNNLFLGLNYFETSSSYRFTFREILSLISHLILGEFNQNQPFKSLIEKNNEILKPGNTFHDKVKILNGFVKSYYPHILFPYYPTLNKNQIDSIKTIKSDNSWSNDEYDIRTVLKTILGNERSNNEGSTIKRLLKWDDFIALDPSRSTSTKPIDGTSITMKGIDYAFSRSIIDGLDFAKQLLTNSEIDYLNLLSQAEENSLNYNNIKLNMQDTAERTRGILRRYCSIFVKRSIGVRYGFFSNKEVFDRFIEIIRHASNSYDFLRDDFRDILLEDNQLVVSFCSNISQQNGSLEHDAKVKIDCPMIKPDNRNFNTKNLPRWNYIYFKFDDNHQMSDNRTHLINYQLFHAIYSKKHLGLNISCLSPEVIMHIDNLSSLMSGKTIRTSEYFDFKDSKLDLRKDARLRIRGNSFELLNS